MTINGNHMSEGGCYQHHSFRDMAVYSMLTVAYRLFSQATVIKKLPELEELYVQNAPSVQDLHELIMQLDPPFMDAFRIATCFENMFKAQLLSFGYVVHIIDNKKQLHLHNQQKIRPIKVSEIRSLERKTWKRKGPFQIESLKKKSLTLYHITSTKKYQNSLRLSARFIESLNEIRKHRNTIHLLINDIGRYSNKIVLSYSYLKEVVNKRLLNKHNEIIDRWEHMRTNPTLRLNEI